MLTLIILVVDRNILLKCFVVGLIYRKSAFFFSLSFERIWCEIENINGSTCFQSNTVAGLGLCKSVRNFLEKKTKERRAKQLYEFKISFVFHI